MSNNNFEELLEKIRRGEKLESVDEYSDLANHYWDNDRTQVKEILTIAKNHNKLSPRGHYTLGLETYLEGKEQEAKKIWIEATQVENPVPEAFGALVNFTDNVQEQVEIIRTARNKNAMDDQLYRYLIINSPFEESISLAQEAINKNMTSDAAFDFALYGAEKLEEKLDLTERAIKEDKTSISIFSTNLQILHEKKDNKLLDRIYEAIKKYGDKIVNEEKETNYTAVLAAVFLDNDAKKIINTLGPHRAEEMATHGVSLLIKKYYELNQPNEVIKMLEERLENNLLTSKETILAQYLFSEEEDYENSVVAGEIGLKLKEVDATVLKFLTIDYNKLNQHEKGFEITTKLLEIGDDDTLTHYYRSKHACHLKKYDVGLKHGLIIKDRDELGVKEAQVLALNIRGLPSTDELHNIAKEITPKLTERDILNYETSKGRTLVDGLLEKSIEKNKLLPEHYFIMINRAREEKDVKKAFSIGEIAKKNNLFDYSLASILGVTAIDNKLYDKAVEFLAPFEDKWEIADTVGVALSYQETYNKEGALALGEKIVNGIFKGEYDSNVLHIIHNLTKDKAYFDLIKKYAKDNPKQAEPLGSLLIISNEQDYELDTKTTTKKLLNIMKNKNMFSKLKELDGGTAVVKAFDQHPLKSTIFVKQKNEPHTQEIKYRKKVENALKKHNVLVKTPDYIGKHKDSDGHYYITSFKKGIKYTDILDVKLTSIDFIDTLLKHNYIDNGILQIQALIIDAMAAIYVEMPEPNLPIYDFRQKFIDKGYDAKVLDAFEGYIQFLEASPHMCYFNDSWSDNWIVSDEGVVLTDTENRGRMPITVDAAHFMAHSGQGDVTVALSGGNFLLNRINEYGKSSGRVIEDKNKFAYEYMVGTLMRSALNARTRGQIEKRYDTAYFIAESGVNMFEWMKKEDLITQDKDSKIIEDVLKNEQETYKQLFWDEIENSGNNKYIPKENEVEMYNNRLQQAKEHRISDAKGRRDMFFKSFMSVFLENNMFTNEKFAEKVRAYINKD